MKQIMENFLHLTVTALKGQFTQKKKKICQHLLTLHLFQTCMSFFLLLNTQDYILVNKQLTVAIDFHSILSYYGSQWLPSTVKGGRYQTLMMYDKNT